MNSFHLEKRGLAAVAGLGLLLSAGCKENHTHDDEHDHHDDESKTAQISVWDGGYEIFAEHRFVVAAQPTKFVTHVTELQTGDPRTAGPITYRFWQGQDGLVEHVENTPTRPGIYESTLTFPKAGDWNFSIAIPAEGKAATIALPAIKVFATEHDAQHAEPPKTPEGIAFLKEQQWKIRLGTALVGRRKLAERVQVVAQTRAKPGFSASVAAPLAGQLAAAEGRTFPMPGERVEAGDILTILRPRFSDAAARFIEIEAEFGSAEAVLKQAEAAYERTKKLAAAQAKSERELQEAEAALASARARQAAAAALRSTYSSKPSRDATSQGAVSFVEVRAPIAGIVMTVSAGIGEPVTENQVLFTVLNPETVWIEARVPEVAVASVENSKDALCENLDGSERHFSIAAENGRRVFLGLEVDAETRTIPLIYELNNTNARLRIGQMVRLHVETANAQDALAIPHSALVEEGGVFVAFVQVAGETFQKRELRLGIRDGDWVQVLSGLNEGERVVTRGAYALRLASVSGVVPSHGHAH